MILVVSGFVLIPDHPRPAADYDELIERLFETNIPLLVMEGDLEQCWLYRYLNEHDIEFTCSVADNPQKNTPAYMVVQAQKSEWLAAAAEYRPAADVLVWLDAGIFHIPGVTSRIIEDFIRRAATEQAIAIPGCWDRDYEYDDLYPMWRFCGGTLVVPRKYVVAFDAAMKAEYKRWLRLTGNLSWEVNTLARLEKANVLPIWQYRANHDHTMFTNYQSGENADGQQTKN